MKLKPETGRTHQIRVHLSSVGHPIFSDEQYSGGRNRIKSYHVKYNQMLKRLFKLIDRVALHAYQIKFKHPSNNQEICFSAPLPADFNQALEFLKSVKVETSSHIFEPNNYGSFVISDFSWYSDHSASTGAKTVVKTSTGDA